MQLILISVPRSRGPFEKWMDEVRYIITSRLGLSLDQMTEQWNIDTSLEIWLSAYADGLTPIKACKKILVEQLEKD